MSKKQGISRRSFLKTSGMAAGAALAGGAALALGAPLDSGNAMAANAPAHAAHAAMGETPELFRGKMFFTNFLDFAVLSAAAERIFPADKNGPGAIDLAVPYFIDNQLAGAYGYNAREYMKGPYYDGAPGLGYQTSMNNRELFLQGVRALNREAQARYKNDFPQLEDAQKDAILKDCEAGRIKLPGINSGYFFSRLRLAVLAGAYADPIYNGNNDMNGWKMKQFPGAQMSYADIITDKTFQNIEPVSLAEMQ